MTGEPGNPRVGFEIGPLISPLEQLITAREREPGHDPSLEVLRSALRLSRGEADLLVEREAFRRSATRTPAETDALAEIADRIGEESYDQQYALMELVQAISVGTCGLSPRNVCSIRLAVAAKLAGRFERARPAYADVLEGTQILRRFFGAVGELIDQAEASAQSGWASVRDRAERRAEIFDTVSANPAAEWMDLVVWNSDFDTGQGLLAQADATARLAFRFDRWLASGRGPLDPPAEEMLSRCEDAARRQQAAETSDEEDVYEAPHSMLAARYLVTVGDALAAVSHWHLAAEAHRRVRDQVGSFAQHPVALHAAIQEAYCHLMAGDVQGCRERLDGIDLASMERLSELILTVAAELARYHAVDQLCRRRLSEAVPPDATTSIEPPMQRVALLAARGDDRGSYLRNLFLAMLRRDVGSIVEHTESRSR